MHFVRDSLSATEDRGDLISRIAIVGLGNPLRGDDAAGPLVVAELQSQLQAAFLLIEQPLDLADSLQGYEAVYIVDACLCGLPAGQVVALSWPSGTLREYRSPSTHTVSLAQSLALGEALGTLPQRVRVFAISGKEFDIGRLPSPAVIEGAIEAARMIAGEVHAWRANS